MYNKTLNDLSKQVLSLTTGFQDLSKTVVSALENISAAQSGVSDPMYKYSKHLAALKPADFNNLLYWYRAPWSEIRNGSKPIVKGDDPILTLFCEDATGQLVPKSEIQAARNMVKAYFELLWKHKRAPTRWGEAPLDLQIDFIRQMEEEFGFLRYCDRHWKAKQLFMNYYPPWYKNKTKPKDDKKKKRARPDDDDNNDNGQGDGDSHNNDIDNGNGGNDDDDDANRSKRRRVVAEPDPPTTQPTLTTTRKRVCSFIPLAVTLVNNV